MFGTNKTRAIYSWLPPPTTHTYPPHTHPPRMASRFHNPQPCSVHPPRTAPCPHNNENHRTSHTHRNHKAFSKHMSPKIKATPIPPADLTPRHSGRQKVTSLFRDTSTPDNATSVKLVDSTPELSLGEKVPKPPPPKPLPFPGTFYTPPHPYLPSLSRFRPTTRLKKDDKERKMLRTESIQNHAEQIRRRNSKN